MGKESPNSSSMTMKNFKSPLMDLPTSIYMPNDELRLKRQSSYNLRSQLHNYPNYSNFKIHIFFTFSGGVHGLRRQQSRMKEVYAGCNAKIHVFKVYASIIYSKSRTYGNSHIHKKISFLAYFWAFSDFGVFWKVLSDLDTFPTV